MAIRGQIRIGEDFLGGGGGLVARRGGVGAVSLLAGGWPSCFFVVEKGRDSAARAIGIEAIGSFNCLEKILMLAMKMFQFHAQTDDGEWDRVREKETTSRRRRHSLSHNNLASITTLLSLQIYLREI